MPEITSRIHMILEDAEGSRVVFWPGDIIPQDIYELRKPSMVLIDGRDPRFEDIPPEEPTEVEEPDPPAATVSTVSPVSLTVSDADLYDMLDMTDAARWAARDFAVTQKEFEAYGPVSGRYTKPMIREIIKKRADAAGADDAAGDS